MAISISPFRHNINDAPMLTTFLVSTMGMMGKTVIFTSIWEPDKHSLIQMVIYCYYCRYYLHEVSSWPKKWWNPWSFLPVLHETTRYQIKIKIWDKHDFLSRELYLLSVEAASLVKGILNLQARDLGFKSFATPVNRTSLMLQLNKSCFNIALSLHFFPHYSFAHCIVSLSSNVTLGSSYQVFFINLSP